MARRSGKAASRRSRQRKAQRPAPPTTRDTRPAAADDAVSASDVGPSDAFEKADAELRASTPPPGSRPANAGRKPSTVRARPTDFAFGSGPSRLGERAASEYHYVLRDLRNIGVLLVVIAVLLAASVVAVNALGIGPS